MPSVRDRYIWETTFDSRLISFTGFVSLVLGLDTLFTVRSDSSQVDLAFDLLVCLFSHVRPYNLLMHMAPMRKTVGIPFAD